MNFVLDKKLEEDSIFIKSMSICDIRMIKNEEFPWIILVPKINNIVEITDLTERQYSQFANDIRLASMMMQNLYTPDKLNIATIGNVVPQMHVHIVARFKHDRLFPKPIWGNI